MYEECAVVWCIGTYLYFDGSLQSTATVFTIVTVAVTTARRTTATAATITVTSIGGSVDGSVGGSVDVGVRCRAFGPAL